MNGHRSRRHSEQYARAASCDQVHEHSEGIAQSQSWDSRWEEIPRLRSLAPLACAAGMAMLWR